MSDSNNDKTNSDDESNSSDDKTNSTGDESNLNDSLKPLSSSINLYKFAKISYDVPKNLPSVLTDPTDLTDILSSGTEKIASLLADLSSSVPKENLQSVLADLSSDLHKSHKSFLTSIAYSQFVAPSSKQIRKIKHIFESVTDSRTVTTEETQISNLRTSHKERKLVFVLGAGVSKNYGLPDWNILLQKLLIKILEYKQRTSQKLRFNADTNIDTDADIDTDIDIDTDTDVLKTLFPQNPIILARNIQLLLDPSDEVCLESLVRSIIYEQINDTKIDRTFEELQKLCTLCETDQNIDSVITFNFDDILEKYLTPEVCEPIYEAGIQPNSRKLPIYHVHGFLPRKESKEKLDSSNKITFSEDLYHQLYTDVYCWSNIVQIDKFTNNTCLFIGISLTDPNLRRLLDVAKKLRGNESAPHYIIKERYNKAKIVAKVSKTGTCEEIHKRKETIQKYEDEDLLQSLFYYIEDSEGRDALSLGVDIIWVDNYNEDIPKILQKIRSS